DFPDCETVRLEQNYRSSGNILKAANALIDHNMGRLGKKLWTDDSEGEKLHLYAAFNELDEARYIAGRIKQWVDSGNMRSDIAILYRSNAQSRVFESTFNENGIPYRVYGGQRFFERAEIKDALAYLRLSVNPADDASFERIVNHPPRGIGERTVEMLRQIARAEQRSMWEVAAEAVGSGEFTARASGAIGRFIELVKQMNEESNGLPLSERVEAVISLSNLKDHFLTKEKGEQGQGRVDNLSELITAAHGYVHVQSDEMPDMDELSSFLAHAALEAGDGQGDVGDDCIQMMTLHSAKGLEFPMVFLSGLEEGLFPHQMSVDEPGRLEEERRLCYVGITRAEQQLVISYAEQRQLHGQTRFNPPSRFLRELPEELVEEIRPKVQTYQTSYRSAKSYQAKPQRPAQRKGTSTESGFQIGQLVSHAKFGEGVITSAEGSGTHARVEVNFQSAGLKWLVLAYANLEKV
ncbi:MAG: ATP-dependent DNA helicase UvrD/PcrA, partial [uncultured Thiotrichaceae bacterium]